MAFASRAILLGTALVLSTTAVAVRADCVDFDPKRAKVAGAALARNPPSAAQLGLPDLDGLTIDGPRTTGEFGSLASPLQQREHKPINCPL